MFPSVTGHRVPSISLQAAGHRTLHALQQLRALAVTQRPGSRHDTDVEQLETWLAGALGASCCY